MFDFNLPSQLIRQTPLTERSQSRLMSLCQSTGRLEHGKFSEITQLLSTNDVLFVNNTKVMPARLHGRKETGATVEIMVEQVVGPSTLTALLKCNSRLKPGTHIVIDESNRLEIISCGEICQLKLIGSTDLFNLINQYGQTPLPPYIKRPLHPSDPERYQTVYAEQTGAVAAPTAGLHFSHALMQAIRSKNIPIIPITLHIGAGTYKPIKPGQTELHTERYEISAMAADQWQQAKQAGRRIIAVGTTTTRALESWCLNHANQPGQYTTNLWIKPGFKFQAVDALITNFHLPKSSLLDLVSAFSTETHIKQAYQTAIACNYHFFSYGDAMFIHP